MVEITLSLFCFVHCIIKAISEGADYVLYMSIYAEEKE